MTIQVLGSGCKKCKELYERTQQAVREIGLDAPVEYITDVQKLLTMGVLSSPVLAVDGKPIMAGVLPDVQKIAELIGAAAKN
jgi:small redox-active disulfide protein 2